MLLSGSFTPCRPSSSEDLRGHKHHGATCAASRALQWVGMACRGLLLSPSWCAQAYESLAILEATSTMAQRALESNSKLKGNDSRNISAYFNKANPWPCPCAGTVCAMQSMHHTEQVTWPLGVVRRMPCGICVPQAV